ncbi:MAG: hypothetical protein AAFU54_07105 [Chloroflexota bacterium]
MATLVSVITALDKGDQREALILLQKVLKENPSADAHYLAAKMAPNALMAKKQLAHALHYDPTCEKALTMLAVIQREEALSSSTGKLRDTLLEEEAQEDTGNYFSRFSRWFAPAS